VDEILARAGIFHAVESDVASGLTIRMHNVDFRCPHTFFADSDTDWGDRPGGLGGRALVLQPVRPVIRR
jgi:hypothetical protein